MCVIRACGVESEAELAFSGLHHLCSQMMEGGLDRLPVPQREALGMAFGLNVGGPPDPFLVGLAVKPDSGHRRRAAAAVRR